jgi:hypothetical protein
MAVRRDSTAGVLPRKSLKSAGSGERVVTAMMIRLAGGVGGGW